MVWIGIIILMLTSLALLGGGLLQRGGVYGFPFLAAAMFLTFVLPQIPGLVDDRFMPQDGALTRAVFFSWLCLVMCAVGWALGRHAGIGWDHAFSEQRLLIYAAMLSLLGAYFFHKFGQLDDEERLRGFLTGTAVAYLFFAKPLTYGLAIALLCFARRRSLAALWIILFDGVFYFDRIVIAGRRGDAAELALMIALALWFHRRYVVPRSVVCLSLVFTIIGLLGAGEYRAATFYGGGSPDWRAVLDIDIADNWHKLVSQGGPEFRNLAFSLSYVSKNNAYDYGANHWNTLVNSYVPAQIIGSAAKDRLYIHSPSRYAMDYEPAPGTTPTGMMDAFASFSYYGCLKFALVGALLAGIYTRAMHGNTAMQLLYMLSVMPAMLVVTHFTNEIAIAWVHIAFFMIPGLLFARIPAKRPPHEASPSNLSTSPTMRV